MKTHELPPNAARVIESLRDAGYSFNTAVADIIDNSIAAGSNNINVACTMRADNGEITIAIADNGCGMTLEEACNAMTYGSAEREDIHSLGKFGLGLKTASTSQCRRLSLITRTSKLTDTVKLVLDIDYAQKVNKWAYLELDPTAFDLRHLNHVAENHSGTLVLWENCDRILGRQYKNPGSTAQRKALDKKIADLRFHIGMVFQRFIDPEDERARTVTIAVNGKPVEAWDPFCNGLDATDLVKDTRVNVTGIGAEKRYFDIAAYVVPNRDEVFHENEQLIFPEGISPDDLQGIYVYRENRLIKWGDWCNLYKTEFHDRLCRIELSFDANLDTCFNVDFKKSQIEINPSIAEWLKTEVLNNARKRAEERYRNGSVAAMKKEADSVHKGANLALAKKAASERTYLVQKMDDGSFTIQNPKGNTFVESQSNENERPDSIIQGVDSLPDGVLWAPAIMKTTDGVYQTKVKINVSHPYYHKLMVLFKDNPNAVKAFDYIFWALANSEFSTKDTDCAENYADLSEYLQEWLPLIIEFGFHHYCVWFPVAAAVVTAAA